METEKVIVKITNPRSEPLRLAEFIARDENGQAIIEEGVIKHMKEFFKGDIAEVERPTALHLIASEQAELAEGQSLESKNNGEGA